MIWYQNLENGNFYRISRNRVLFRRGPGMWARHETLKPCDLAHFPFIGVNVIHPFPDPVRCQVVMFPSNEVVK